MRIALVTALYPPEFEGGTERVVRTQARALAQRGHSVLVVSGSGAVHDGRDVLWDRDGSVEVARLPRLANEPWELELARPRLEKLAARLVERAAVVHLHHWTTLSSGMAQAIARERPVVLTLHDAFSSCARSFRRSPDPSITCPRGDVTIPCVRCLAPDAGQLSEVELARGLDARRKAFSGEIAAASALLAPSRFQAQRMERALGLEPGRIQVVPHGLCRDLPQPAARADWDGRSPLRVLHFGNLVEAKGILDLVRTLSSLPRGAAELDLAGSLLEPELTGAVEAERGELAVRWTGPYRTRSLAELGARAHLAAFPSLLDETYGLVLDEAAALGLPIWVSDRGALPERSLELGSGGRCLPAGDAGTWRAAFEELLAHPPALAAERARLVPPPGPQAAVARLETLYGALSAARA